MMELSDYRRGLFQWDTGRSLIVTEKDITEVHFQLLPPPSGSTETTDVPVSAGIAKIPDELLQSGLPIRAYAWGDGYSHYDQTFCVTKREKPTGYASDPADAITLESVQAKLQAEIDGKIQMPDGGDAGDVLKKTESGVEWGQAAGQSDWAENDETAPGYVKNRPFYTGDPVETVLVEESTVTFANANGTIYMGQIRSNFEATVGELFEVYWDGTTYESPCVNFRGSLFIGNLSITGVGSDTGEPFLMYVVNGMGIEIYTLDTSASHTFSIITYIAEVIQIPDKYISDTFRDVVIAGNPLNWSEDDWTKYYKLFKNGKLLKINNIASSHDECYILSMFYSPGIYNMSVINSTGDLYKLGINQNNEKIEFYWAPIIYGGEFYFRYIKTGSNTDSVKSEEYQRLELSDGLKFTTKNANEGAVKQKVMLEGDKEIILSSSTSGSAKKFKITVDDSGAISATEV